MITWPSRPSAGRQPSQSTKGSSRETFSLCEGSVVGTRRARCREDGSIRLLRRMREVTLEAVEEDRGAAFGDRKRVPPESECDPEPEVRPEERVRALARQIRARRWHGDADGVELLVEGDPPELDAAQ